MFNKQELTKQVVFDPLALLLHTHKKNGLLLLLLFDELVSNISASTTTVEGERQRTEQHIQ